jgi:5'-3' exonuclease
MTRPLLVIDGDSFAHRSYHALPKTIRRRGNKGAGAILGFANFLLRLFESEQPHALQVNINGGRLPDADASGKRFLRIPLGAFPDAAW